MNTKKKTRSPSRRDQAIAHHEAGHAVAQFHLPLAGRTRKATIVAHEDSLGHVAHYLRPSFRPDIDDNSPRAVVTMFHRIQVLLAGNIAQKRFSGHHHHLSSRGDQSKAADFALIIDPVGARATALIKWLWLRTEGLISLHWREVRAVAQALLREKTLTGTQVRTVINAERAKQQLAWQRKHPLPAITVREV